MFSMAKTSLKSQTLPLLVTIIIAVSAGAGVGTWTLVSVSCMIIRPAVCDITNWQSLVLEGMMFGGGLGSFFYFLQRKNSERIEKIIENIDERDTARKKFWLGRTHSQVKSIIDMHYFAISCCQKTLNDDGNQSVMNEKANLKAQYVNLESWYIPQLDRAMTQVAVLVNPEFYDDISHNNYDPFKSMISKALDNLGDKDKTQDTIRLIEERISVFKYFVDRIEKEMPANKL